MSKFSYPDSSVSAAWKEASDIRLESLLYTRFFFLLFLDDCSRAVLACLLFRLLICVSISRKTVFWEDASFTTMLDVIYYLWFFLIAQRVFGWLRTIFEYINFYHLQVFWHVFAKRSIHFGILWQILQAMHRFIWTCW